ncbi:MAG: CYTH domain-containing protein [Azovibrio sp.]|nr:CYTH domain-containing protein [Azovibrio sp.]
MPQEIELKLALPVRQAPHLRRHPLLAGIPASKRCLRNLYFDTPEQLLRQHRIALRRRQIGARWLLTVKTAEHAATGLSRRYEWEYPLPPDQLDFSPIDAPAVRHLLETHAPRLQLAFRTDFVRTAWQLEHAGARIELALDLGYIRTHSRRAALHEVELELIAGPEASLAALAAQLRQSLPLTPLDPSKAARGFALLTQA